MISLGLAEDHHDRRADHESGDDQGQPPERGHDPDLPGNGNALGQPLVKPGRFAVIVPGEEPGGQVWLDVVDPAVLGGGEVVGRGQPAAPGSGPAARGKHCRD